MTLSILVSNETDDQAGIQLLGKIEGVNVLPYDPNTLELTEEQRGAQIMMPPFRGSHRALPLLGQLENLQMVQLLSAGADEWIGDTPKHVVLASARGAHGRPISEWVMSAVLALYRQWPALVRFQDEHVWAHRRVDADTLAGKRVLVVGAGAIGTTVAQRMKAFEASATLVARTAREGIRASVDLPELVPGHDIVVIAAPINDETRGLVNKEFLAAMPDGAVLVNVGRGQIVDTDALTAELQTGRLRAALDVTEPEPLPADHPIWACENVIISPHMSRTVPGTNVLCYEVAARQISTYVTGGTPSNLVQRDS
ncbi:NAD(P)-dependent oxidoreductase [Kibdelosporangium lantanae]|uniref:NAD(P)-dependent oxidoreductase n=1 Tax=Kibdelosporangium lantanae TaxID=1497396 RepID=A0ABW3M5E8_9PSEU